ncbi:hypothetical protein [Actinocorallia sp. A-T 12471]|uniref:hypothetical protein n=1 Tax=Actinocorallia sp. A-T 12471 TaxID=3089813 RepID=UPI0029D10E22|nr:hypothetical protein [Actinocorallia sp. A-T 12471]MDX6739002.1 hypothetical protein [Actinocorallia sp. A-T 12471]
MRAPRPGRVPRSGPRVRRAAIRLVRAALAAVLVTVPVQACGGYTPPGRLNTPPLPTPDICAGLPAELVADALGGKPSTCGSATEDGTHAARFTTAKGKGASLVVSYLSRYSADTGLDLWEIYGYVEKERVTLIGVGEDAVFDPKTGVAAAVEGHLIVRAIVQTSDGVRKDDEVAGKLMPVLEAALVLGGTFATSKPRTAEPSRHPSAPVIAP